MNKQLESETEDAEISGIRARLVALRVKRTLWLLVMCAGCGERWDTARVAREECTSFELGYRIEAQARLSDAKARQAKPTSSAAARIDDLLAKGAEEDLAYHRDLFMTKCVPMAETAIAPCAKEFRPGTDSAEACVRRRVEAASLDVAIVLARKP